MASARLVTFLPEAPRALQAIFDTTSGQVQPPIRSEIFGLQRFAQHGRSLAKTHRAAPARMREGDFFPRLHSNIRTLQETHRYIANQIASGYDISPAAEWLLDNFHLIDAQLKEIHEGLPRSYFRALPVLVDEPLAGLPRIYGVAWAFVAHNDGAFDEDTLVHFLNAYQEVRELRLSETWALPTTLRVVLIENLRRLAERLAVQKAAREVANLCCDRIDGCSMTLLQRLLAWLERRGVGRVFLVQMALRLQERGAPGALAQREWLAQALPELAATIAQQSIEQAADNLSVSNAVTALRTIGAADWPEIVERSSALMQLMLTSPNFHAEDTLTRDKTLHGIELLSTHQELSERVVAQSLLGLMNRAASGMVSDRGQAGGGEEIAASYWLEGSGRGELMRTIGIKERAAFAWQASIQRRALPIYLGSLMFGTLALVALVMIDASTGLFNLEASDHARIALWALTAALAVFPASEIVVAVVNRLISESAKPQHLPRLALLKGIPPEHRVMVAIPAMLTDQSSIDQLIHRLQLHYLANPEAHAQFALLSDWTDADSARLESDEVLLAIASRGVARLNALYPLPDADGLLAPRFALLHRARRFSKSEQRWIGWERKRGKIEQLVTVLVNEPRDEFLDMGALSRVARNTRYLVTLDSDTQLPPGRLRELVAVAAHPYNQPRLDVEGRALIGGYAIFQPRIVTPLPAIKEMTLFHRLFSGQGGIDPYSAASSEVYQDLFGEGTFTGKGLLNVQAMQAVLASRLPEERVLSHDLLEGSLARCAAITDIALIEEAPFHSDVAASRVHRWTRGDWQLLPFLLNPKRYRMHPINRWKMLDNLRRSLVAPTCLVFVLLTLAVPIVSPLTALGLVFAAFCAGPVMGALAGLMPTRRDLAKRHFFKSGFSELGRALCAGLWHLAQLLQHSLMSVDAIARSLYRMIISQRGLLQWTTAQAAQAAAKTGFAAIVRQHWSVPLVAVLLLSALLALSTPFAPLALAVTLLWAASPVWTWLASRPSFASGRNQLPSQERVRLAAIARDSWRFFERCVGAQDNYLPPDNLQTTPRDMVAHRTSPTNIGMYLLSAACARQFGWIGTEELISRIDSTLKTLATLQRHRGHFLNWYDTKSCSPLLPMYVSTVDSGNLSGHLLAVAQACRELSDAPYENRSTRVAIEASIQRIEPLLAQLPRLLSTLLAEGALARILALGDPLSVCTQNIEQFGFLLREASEEFAALDVNNGEQFAPVKSTPADELRWCIADHLAVLQSALRDVVRSSSDIRPLTAAVPDGEELARERLQAIAGHCERMAWEPNFSFLFHARRYLFHIGYRVGEQQLDASFYDLLASESRLTSLLAIAKGDVPVRHWWSVARPFFAVGAQTGLRSWSGSMFEYLMPTLTLDEPHGSVLQAACQSAVREQIAYAKSREVPWGISESAYADSDQTLAYQYGPQGVPRLALRRTPPDELVVAPYATALAAQFSPLDAANNFSALAALAARGRYGFIEALDFSPSRQTGAERFTAVATFMAHHQGMSIVALANLLLDNPARRWGMSNPHIEAVSSLLHERVPREVSMLIALPSGAPLHPAERRASGLQREVIPGVSAIEPTHLLSNGRYSVSLRANGAGSSKLGTIAITRARDDALRDAFGSFFYVRWDRKALPVSITQHPAPDATAQYHCVYHADRVCFEATWPELQAHITIWVSPEDDIEFRQVELRNLSERSLDIELMSSFEVTLSEPRADEGHPTFSNMFVSAKWHAAQNSLVFERKPRLATEQGLQMAHFLADSDPQVVDVRVQADRLRWLGRNHCASQPLASFDAHGDSESGREGGSQTLDTGLDPVCAMSVRLRIAPNAKAKLTFATTASASGEVLRAVVDKYFQQSSHVQRASMMSATLTGIRLRVLRITNENHATIQSLTTALLLTLTKEPSRQAQDRSAEPKAMDRRLLWRFGISSDRPIILVTANVAHGMGLLRSLVQALHVWSWAGVACDLVIVNAEPSSYLMTLQRELIVLRERYLADRSTDRSHSGPANVAFHLLRIEELSPDELNTLRSLARVRFSADGRPLLQHVLEWRKAHEQALSERQETSTCTLAVAGGGESAVRASAGKFVDSSGEFEFSVHARLRPPRPWINVLANPNFGSQLSEAGGGYSWAVNSRLNQITAWSNDPVADTPAEWFLLQDTKTLEVWSIAPCAWGDVRLSYYVTHGQGYSMITHRRGELEVSASWCVDAKTSVKQVRLRLRNHGLKPLALRAIGIAEWIMGASRADRSTVHTSLYRLNLPPWELTGLSDDIVRARKLTALMCTQTDRSAGFGGGTAFLAVVGAPSEPQDWTCDRRECFDARGRLVLPDQFGERSGAGLDPCAALAINLQVPASSVLERVFLLGFSDSPEAARKLATQAASVTATARLEQVRDQWNQLLGATSVQTPDRLFDAMVNRWLLYQTVSCRLWAKAGFYQAGGATGFRDQLQDTLALSWAAPEFLRQQIVTCASRQFVEGDVQHWWHMPTGAGVRTHFSDDLLWLPYACAHYVRATGDRALLDQMVAFIDGAAIPDGAEDAYYAPTLSDSTASVYEHAARTIDRSLRVGAHGLPLMGSGDWNDGMNRVGHEGRGESVWLGWFLVTVVAEFAPLARERGELARVQRWEAAARGWTTALEAAAWDGQWYRRAFFDDGQPLGSQTNGEGRIDLIAQAWAVLSDAAPAQRQQQALAQVAAQLVDDETGLIKLLDPPLVNAVPSAGYIQAYPPGVRENGGQYSHAGIWALMAQAKAARRMPAAADHGDLAYRYFTYLSPAHRAAHPTHGAVYGIEPYAIAGDVYTAPPYVGRGGWSWYTGAAAWLHRAAIESIFGLRQTALTLSFEPCLPSHWQQAEITLRRDGREMRFILFRSQGLADENRQTEHAALVRSGAKTLNPGQELEMRGLPPQSCYLITLP